MAIKAGATGRCPHCKLSVRFEPTSIFRGGGNHGQIDPIGFVSPSNHRLEMASAGCPACGRLILTALSSVEPGQNGVSVDAQLWPDTGARPVPAEVEAEAPVLAADFREAVTVFPKSKKASAALSRRCLQMILTTKGGAKLKDLATQIDEVLPLLPTAIGDNVDAVRQIGNFAAHPIKSKSTGEIVEVEEGEAEWLLEVLEELFEHFYVATARAEARRASLNRKLSGIGKPPLKSSGSSTA